MAADALTKNGLWWQTLLALRVIPSIESNSQRVSPAKINADGPDFARCCREFEPHGFR